ncbi:MAG: MopE-related protein, partial [Myxococcota bacterium]
DTDTDTAPPPCEDADGDGWCADEDCDDRDAAVSPGATEVCNDGVDDDCDGVSEGNDDSLADGTWRYRDADEDGYGDPDDAMLSCTGLRGYTTTGGDCDDADAATFPGAEEACDGADDDCDGVADDGATGGDTWYADADGDGYGDPSSSTVSCEAPSGYVSNARDCDDADAATTLCGSGGDDGTICASLMGTDDGHVPTWTGTCDSTAGFSEYDGHCYYAVTASTLWPDARASCVAAGGHLATATTDGESDFVYGLAGRAYAGACDADVEGTFTWITGETWDYTDWGAGEPNDFTTGEDCFEITGTNDTWNDIWCDTNPYTPSYVCEFE